VNSDTFSSAEYFPTASYVFSVFDPSDAMRFRTLPPSSTAELEKVTRSIAGGIYRLLERRGFGQNDNPVADAEIRDESLLASLYAASVGLRIATGPREGAGSACMPMSLFRPVIASASNVYAVTLRAHL
jgi:hypothetical protein